MDREIKEKARVSASFYRDHLLEDVMPFWMNSDLIDTEFGGLITSVDRYGRKYNDDKSVWFQGRGLWTFSALCRKYGNRDEWLSAAVNAKNFLEKYCVDSDDRMFFQVTIEGKPLRKRRYFYSESFYVVGMAEYGALTSDKDALEKAEKAFDMMLSIWRDPGSDPFRITPKSFAQTRSERTAAVPMVLVSCAQILRRCDPMREEYYSRIVREVADSIIRYHYKPEMKCVLENVLSDGTYISNPSGRTINPGHSCENAWFLMSEAVYSSDDDLLAKALNILNWSLEKGWDEEHGGILYFVDAENRPCEQLEWDMKLWWVHNEALIATLYAYQLTGNTKYWEWFEKIHAYTFAHFHDKENGEWYGYLHRDGTVSHTQKGSMWKGPYHLPRCLIICEEILDRIASGEAPKSVL
ncbi:MAG: AGE family epimerase/isomerase [Saccharofermentanales bacterium]